MQNNCGSPVADPSRRLPWVDLLRGICMVAILLNHTEVYFTGVNIIDYNAYTVDALVIFFFLSGYLFFKPQGFSLRHKLHSILRGLVVPYFVFTAVIAVPKALAHGNDVVLSSIAKDILLGHVSWFVTALIVAELIFALILQVTRNKTIPLVLLSSLCFLISVAMPTSGQPYPWTIDNGLQAVLFLCGGYCFHRYEQRLEQWLTAKYIVLALTLLVGLKDWVYSNNDILMLGPINISNYPAFFLDAFLAVWFLVPLSKRLPLCAFLEWTGQRSLVYYFFCGGVPLIVSRIAEAVGFTYMGHYYRVVIILAVVYLLTSAIAWAVYRFVPFIVGKKRP